MGCSEDHAAPDYLFVTGAEAVLLPYMGTWIQLAERANPVYSTFCHKPPADHSRLPYF